MNDHDWAQVTAEHPGYDEIREHKRPDGRYSFILPHWEERSADLANAGQAGNYSDTDPDLIRRSGKHLKYPVTYRVTLKKNRSGVVNPNEYTYSSGEHRPYGRIERNH